MVRTEGSVWMNKKVVIIFVLLILLTIIWILFFKKEAWKDDSHAPDLYYQALDAFSKGESESGFEKINSLMRQYSSEIWRKRWNFIFGYYKLEQEEASAAFKHFNRSYTEKDLLKDYTLYFGGLSALRAGYISEAEERLNRFVHEYQANEFFQSALFLLADCMIESDNLDGARKVLLQYQDQMKSDDGAALQLKLAEILKKEGKIDEATQSYKKIYCLFPLSPEAETVKALLGLDESFRKVWTTEDIPMLLERGDALEKASRYDDALELCTFIRDLFPEKIHDREIDLRTGRILFNARRYSKAYPFLTKAKDDTRYGAEARFILARIDGRLGRRRTFLREMKRLSENIREEQLAQQAAAMLAEYYDSHGEWNNALSFYQAFISLGLPAENSQKVRWRIACILYMKHRYQDSLFQLRRIINEKENPYAIPASFWAARCLERMQRKSEAEELYLAVIRRSEKSYYGLRAHDRLKELGRWQTSSTKNIHVADRNAEQGSHLQVDFARAEELLQMGLNDLAFEHLKGALVKRTGEKGATLLRAAEMAMQHRSVDRAVEFLHIAASLDPAPPIPDELLKLLYPREKTDEICSIARSYSLDCNLVLALILQESSFNSAAVSRAGAIGLMQIMPTTGEEIARRIGKKGHERTMLFRGDYNVLLGCSHLSRLLDTFDGSLELSLAAYNAGEANARAWRRRFRHHEMEVLVDNIPIFETRNYIKRILSNYSQYKELYGN